MSLMVAGCLSASLLHARVFSSRSLDFRDPASYRRLIYKTLMEINGGKADVNVVASDHGAVSLESTLASRPGPPLRAMLLKISSETPELLITVTQSPAERSLSLSKRAQHRLVDVPFPSDGVVLGTLKNTDTRSTFERFVTRMGETEAIRFYEGGMKKSGWSGMIGADNSSSVLLFVKGADICVVMVTAQESNGETSITLLHKQGAVN